MRSKRQQSLSRYVGKQSDMFEAAQTWYSVVQNVQGWFQLEIKPLLFINVYILYYEVINKPVNSDPYVFCQ